MWFGIGIICLITNVISGLHWKSYGNDTVKDSIISLQMRKTVLKIDVERSDQVIIVKDIEDKKITITIYCFIAGYSNRSKIAFQFCKDFDCSGPHIDGDDTKKVTFHGMSLTITTKFNNEKGMKLEFVLPSAQVDSSGNFYCKAFEQNGYFSIRSVNIEIRDHIYWARNSVMNANNRKTRHKSITRLDLPIKFPCVDGGLSMNPGRPQWADQEFSSPVFWSVCPVKNNFDELPAVDKVSFTSCVKYTGERWTQPDETLKPLDLHQIKWRYLLDGSGSLTIFDLEPDFKYSHVTLALMCYIRSSTLVEPINTFIADSSGDDIRQGVPFDESTPAKWPAKIVAISEPVQRVNLFARKIPSSRENLVYSTSISAQYRSNPLVNFFWLHNGIRLNNDRHRESDRFKVDFKGDISDDMAGNYTLVVSHNEQTMSFTIIVSVLGAPVLTNPDCIPIVKYVWENDSATFPCTYQRRPDELKIQINSQEIKLDNSQTSSNKNLGQSYPYLRDLSFNITPANYIPSENVTMTYQVNKLRKFLNQYQDHSITFIVKNSYGVSVRSSTIYTLLKVHSQISYFPDQYHCEEQCMSGAPHYFRCRFNAEEYRNKELKVDHYWTINGYRLDELNNPDNLFPSYFEIEEPTKDLKLLPIKSNNTVRDKLVKKALKSNIIECHIDLTSTASEFTFRSDNDRLRARIKIDSAPSNLGLIIGIIIAICLIFILIIIVIILHQRMRSMGETYKLEKLEIKQGLNRDQEFEQEQHFQNYENEGDHLEKISNNSDNTENPMLSDN